MDRGAGDIGVAVERLSDVGMLPVSILRGVVVDVDVDVEVEVEVDVDTDTDWRMLSMAPDQFIKNLCMGRF